MTACGSAVYPSRMGLGGSRVISYSNSGDLSSPAHATTDVAHTSSDRPARWLAMAVLRSAFAQIEGFVVLRRRHAPSARRSQRRTDAPVGHVAFPLRSA